MYPLPADLDRVMWLGWAVGVSVMLMGVGLLKGGEARERAWAWGVIGAGVAVLVVNRLIRFA